MISATFIFKQYKSDDSFQRLDNEIELLVSKEPDFLGKDVWENREKEICAVVYYFSTNHGLDALRNFSAHREAKSQYKNWYEGYHVIISEVTKAYGDGWLDHPTMNFKK